ncbi:MAG: type II secretion system minor pseudopilin GspJ [Gammaproteobacteria bacterium]
MRRRAPGRRQHGFTLLELLLAIAIFAVLSVLAYGGLRHVITLDAGLRVASTRHAEVELALLLLEQDFREAVPRGVRDELGGTVPALRAGLDGDLLVLTRRVPDLPTITRGAALARIRYRLEDGALYRDVWAQLDRTPATAYQTRRLLSDVQNLVLRFHGTASWSELWPPASGATLADLLPDGVEIVVEFAHGLSVRRVVVMAG